MPGSRPMISTASPGRVRGSPTKWPTGSRVIIRRERPHPGAQLRFTDTDGHRFTAFITDTTGGQLADLEVHHRSHARVEDRIRCGTATGLTSLYYVFTGHSVVRENYT